MCFKQTADSDTISTYQISLVQLGPYKRVD